MSKPVNTLTKSNAVDSHIEIGSSRRAHCPGTHDAEIESVRRRLAKSGREYYEVRARILSGDHQDDRAYGPVFPGRSMEKFLQALGHDPEEIGGNLPGKIVIGQTVRITVEEKEYETSEGVTKSGCSITKFEAVE